MNLLIATGNAGKLRELRELLAPLGHEVVGLRDVKTHGEPVEDADTFAGNAEIKARFYQTQTGLVTIADDSGLCVDALDGRPGVHSARFSGPDASDAENNVELLRVMKGVTDRSARFVCVATCVRADGRPLATRGECEGVILDVLRGEGGFGYDPLFYVSEHDATFAQLPAEIKNQISHRGRAIRALVARLPEFLAQP